MAEIFIKRASITLEEGDLLHRSFNTEGHVYLRVDDLVYVTVAPSDLNFGDGRPTLDMEYFNDLSDLADGFKWVPYSSDSSYLEEFDD